MAGSGFTYRLEGVRGVQKALDRLDRKLRREILEDAFRASERRIRARVLVNIGGGVLSFHDGELFAGFAEAPSRTFRAGFGLTVGIAFPSRSTLGIEGSDPYYYPIAVEYGHVTPDGGFVEARPYVRPAVNDHEREEYRKIGAAIRRGISRIQWPQAR